MQRAIEIAARGRYTCHPNPRVGCVIVKDDKVVGQGWHARTGDAHAEVNALADAGELSRGATAYVSLEPCDHVGKTPPCTRALLDAGVAEVICAMQDPNPEVAGRGFKTLTAAGVTVRNGLLADEAQALNRGFVSRMQRNQPFVRLKIAASLDGATAMKSGESKWITGDLAREDVQRLRAESGAIMTGIGTVLEDDPSLTVRDNSLTDVQPTRVVVDSKLRMPASAKMLSLPGATRVYCVDDTKREALESAGASIHVARKAQSSVDLKQVLADLATVGINDLLVEAGPTLTGALLEGGLVDELVIYQAPHIMGSNTRGMFETPAWSHLSDRIELNVSNVQTIGRDMRITASPK